MEAPDLLLAADERRLRRGVDVTRRDEPRRPDRLSAALHLQLAERLEHEAVAKSPDDGLAYGDRSGRGSRLQACGDVGRIPEGDLLRKSGADEPDGRLSAVDPDPDRELFNPPRPLDFPPVIFDDLADPEC